MKKEIDARGEACPRPVIMTKKALDNRENNIVTTIVDNEVAKDNLSKLAGSYGYSFKIDKTKEDEYYININKGQESMEEEASVCVPDTFKDLTIGIGSDKMGSGEDELGTILMKSYIYTVRETTPWPATVVFYNSGVNLVCEGSEVLDDLRAMEDEGVEIVACGACLDYYHLKDKVKVGQIGNMYSIYEKMRSSNSTINI